MYVSITKFEVKAWWVLPLFYLHAALAHGQARKSRGILSLAVWPEKGNVFCTLTHWESKEQMTAYRNNGRHLKAMKASRKLGRGIALGWESDIMVSKEKAMYKLLHNKESVS